MANRLAAGGLTVFLGSFVLFAARAQTSAKSPPQFVEYPAKMMVGRKAPLKLAKDDMLFRTRYRQLHRSKANFAGHYIIGLFGCGTECVFPLQVDLQSGRPAKLEFSAGEEVTDCSGEYRDGQGKPVEKDWYFRADSRLLVVGGHMPGLECGARYYEERDGKMIHIMDIPLKKTS